MRPIVCCMLSISLHLVGCAQQPAFSDKGTWVDLTHDFSEQTIYWPNADHFKLETVYDGHTQGGYHYSANRYAAAEHGGTHMDAPIHFDIKGQTVDQIPITQTQGPAFVIDVSDKALKNPDYQIGIEALESFERAHGEIQRNSIVLIRTGYDRFWPDARRYLGTDARGDAAIAQLHFPGLSPEAARWLSEKRFIRAVGLDTASIDPGQSRVFESHRIFAVHSIPIFENLKHLDQLPATGSYVMALPMKIEGGSGAPLRAIALLPL